MTPINRIAHRENNRRLSILNEFSEAYEVYLGGTEYGRISEEPEENTQARAARGILNKINHETTEILEAAGCPAILHWSPPPMIGGRSMDVDLIVNLFRLHQYQIPASDVFDALERAGGMYEANHRRAVMRTINPFFWIGRFIAYLASLPFRFLEHIGLNRRSAESSLIGKLFKGAVELSAGIAAIVGAMKLFGWLDPVITFFGIKP